MAIKRVLLPFCDAIGIGPVMEGAFVAGQLFGAQVQGLFAQRLHIALPITDANVRQNTLQHLMENAHAEKAEKLKQAKEIFETYAKQFQHVESEFVATEENIDGFVSHAARLADISALGSGSYYQKEDWQGIHDAALFNSGRPILLVPPAGVEKRSFERVVIAWKDSIEAARAVAAAQPFLQYAKEVHLITIGEGAKAADSLKDVEQYLQLHRSDLRSELVPPSKAASTGELLLNKPKELSGALLVMGAYSHRRWQERMFGGVTEYVLREARSPILMAH